MTQNPTLSEREALEPCPFCGSTDVHVEETPGVGQYVCCSSCQAQGPFVARIGDPEEAAPPWNRRAPVAPAEPVAEDVSSLIAARCVALPGPLIDCPVCGAVDKERARLEAGGAPLPHCSEDATSAQPSTVTAEKTHRLGYDDHFNLTVPALDYQAMHRRAQQAESRAHCRDKAATWWMQSYFKAAAPPATSPVTGAQVVKQSLTADAATGALVEALADVETALPGAFWLVGKGKVTADEPMFGAQIMFGADEVLGAGEGDTAGEAVRAALTAALAAQKAEG